MGNQVKISSLPAADTLNGNEFVEVVQNGTNKRIATAQLFSKGETGQSAYQVAVANGFTGTEAEWLASLEGAPGPAGSGFIHATFPGAIGPLDSKPRWSPPADIQLKGITLQIDQAPTVDLVLDVLKNGVSIFTDTKPTLSAGQNKSVMTLTVPVSSNDFLTLSIISGNGSDLTARIDYQ